VSKVWFITGTSPRLGRSFAVSALERGDRVAATARDVSSLDELVAKYGVQVLPLTLDVTDRPGVAGTGIKVTLVEPGGFATDWAGSSAVHAAEPNPAYDHIRQAMAARSGSAKYGDPAAAGPALLQIVDADNPPLRVLFGSMPVELVKHPYAQRLQTWNDWEQLSRAAEG